MIRSTFFLLFVLLWVACKNEAFYVLDHKILASMGSKYKNAYMQTAEDFSNRITKDTTDVEALLGLAETNIILYIFGYIPREETIPTAKIAVQRAQKFDATSAEFFRLSGILSFLDWDWTNARVAFVKSIQIDPKNLAARHWYSLYLAAMGDFEESMAQSDTIMTMDPNEDFLVGRGSLFYFQRRFSELRDLMQKTIARDTTLPWGYDWLGMAYNGLEEHQASIDTYFQAFQLSDGTVEVGAGLGHALGQAGEVELAKEMADFYRLQAKQYYLPPVQRSFIHLGIEEYDEALTLLEQAYEEKSWFLIFIKIEPWYDPVRAEERFSDIINRMGFPE